MFTQSQTQNFIKSIPGAGAKFDNLVSDACIGVAVHVFEHGNINLITQLMAAFDGSHSLKRRPVRAWLQNHAPVVLLKDGKTFAYSKEKKAELKEKFGNAQTYFDALMELPTWIEAKKAKKTEKKVDLDLYGMVQKMIDGYITKIAKVDVKDLTAEQLAVLKAQEELLASIKEAGTNWYCKYNISDEDTKPEADKQDQEIQQAFTKWSDKLDQEIQQALAMAS